MTTQKEIEEMFIGLLENISQICDKTTSGNVSHNIATIKYKCRDMLQFYKQYPVTLWHSVTDGDFPQKEKNNNRVEFSVEVLVLLDKNRLDFGRYDYTYKSWYVGLQRVYPTHWMEIPELPTEDTE